MLRRTWLTLALGAVALGCTSPPDGVSGSARPGNDPGLRLAMCGTVRVFTPPSPRARGVLAVDDAAWYVVDGARLSGTELLVVGRDACLEATLDAARRILACDVRRAPETDPWAAWPDPPPE